MDENITPAPDPVSQSKIADTVVESEGAVTADSTNANNGEPELKNDYTEDQFQKSRNSRTAAMFQKHGKLLDDIPSSQTKAKATDKGNSKKSCCFPFCCKRGESSK